MGLEELIREDARMQGELIGMEKGKEIGMEKSRLKTLEALLKEKLDRDMICRIIGVDNNTLDNLIEKLNSSHQN